MNIIRLGEKFDTPIVLALGFFDCIHKGHAMLVRRACEYALEHCGVQSALLTFSNDPSILLAREKQIYSFEERADALKSLGLQNLISTEFDVNFAQSEPLDFLNLITQKLNIAAVITGKDYTFGRRAQGDVNMLKVYCKEKNIEVITVPFEERNGEKISTSSLKELVKIGSVAELNDLLSEPYFIIGNVMHARRVGTRIGFPTANIEASDKRLLLGNGVYATVLQIDGKRFASMTNVGTKPTFDIESFSIEAFILDFDDDIYGKTVKLSFIERLRGISKFASPCELQKQLSFDESRVRDIIKL